MALIFLAGYTSPVKGRVVALDAISSAIAILVLGSYAFLVRSSDHRDWHRTFFFFVLAALMVIFIFALYYSVKSLRGVGSSKEPYPKI